MGRKRKSQLTGTAGVFFKRIMAKKKPVADEKSDDEPKKAQLWKKTENWRPIL